MKRVYVLRTILVGLLCMLLTHDGAPASDRLRIIVMTDIDPGYDDPDDAMSVVRLLMYSNEWDLEGLIATKNRANHSLHPELIGERVEAYGKVRDNLMKHASGWPTKDYLLARVKKGQDGVDMRAVGDGKDTEGSNLIISVVDKPDPRPVWLISWDGLSTPAQALWDVRRDRSKAELDKFTKKIRIYTITEDADCGPWIRKTFPNIHYIWADRGRTWQGISKGGDQSWINDAWRKKNIIYNHGPLGELYPVDVPWCVEGDTPSFLFLMSFNGLCCPMHPDYGGWGGRYKKVNTWWCDTGNGDSNVGERAPGNTIWRWRPAFQNDFAARMDWCVADSYDRANHPPVAAFRGHAGKDIVHLNAAPGQKISLSAAGSTDPDGDKLRLKWLVYPEAGTYKGKVSIKNPNAQKTTITIPDDAEGKTIHIILVVTDSGQPQLNRYRRAVIRVK